MSVVDPGTPVRACFRPAAGGAEECFGTRPDQAALTGPTVSTIPTVP